MCDSESTAQNDLHPRHTQTLAGRLTFDIHIVSALQIWASLAEATSSLDLGHHAVALQQELTRSMPDLKALAEEVNGVEGASANRLHEAMIAACMGCDPPHDLTPGMPLPRRASSL